MYVKHCCHSSVQGAVGGERSLRPLLSPLLLLSLSRRHTLFPASTTNRRTDHTTPHPPSTQGTRKGDIRSRHANRTKSKKQAAWKNNRLFLSSFVRFFFFYSSHFHACSQLRRRERCSSAGPLIRERDRLSEKMR